MKTLFLLLLVVGCAEMHPVQTTDKPPEIIIDSLKTFDGYWYVPLPDSTIYCEIEFRLGSGYWFSWGGEILKNYDLGIIEIYDYEMELINHVYRLMVWK